MTPRLVECTKCRAPPPPAGYNRAEPSAARRAAPRCSWTSSPPRCGQPRAESPRRRCWWKERPVVFTIRPRRPPSLAAVVSASSARCAMSIWLGNTSAPAALKLVKRRASLRSWKTQRTTYDSLALAVAVYPLIIAWFTIIGLRSPCIWQFATGMPRPASPAAAGGGLSSRSSLPFSNSLPGRGVIIAITCSARPR